MTDLITLTDFDERLFRFEVNVPTPAAAYSSDISQIATKAPEGSASSSMNDTGKEVRRSSIMARECSGYALSAGFTDAPSSLTAKYPVEPVTRTAGPSTSVTLPFNRNATTSLLVEMYVTRILRDSSFQRLSTPVASFRDDGLFLLMVMLLGLNWAYQLATEQELFSVPAIERVRAALMLEPFPVYERRSE